MSKGRIMETVSFAFAGIFVLIFLGCSGVAIYSSSVKGDIIFWPGLMFALVFSGLGAFVFIKKAEIKKRKK